MLETNLCAKTERTDDWAKATVVRAVITVMDFM